MTLDIKLPISNSFGDKWKYCELCSDSRMWPKSMVVERDGKYYCKDHYRFRFHNKDIDAIVYEIDEGDRGEP